MELALHPAGRSADPRTNAGHRARAGHAVRARPARQHPPPEHGRVSRRARGIIPNPYNKIPGFSVGARALRAGLPGDGLADDRVGAGRALRHLFRDKAYAEKSVIVFGAMEATLTPLMEADRARPSGREGVQPAQRRPPGVRPPHRPGRQGRARPGRACLCAVAGGPAELLVRDSAPNWCDSEIRTKKVLNPLAPNWCQAHPKVQGPGREKGQKSGTIPSFAGGAMHQLWHRNCIPTAVQYSSTTNHPPGEPDGSQDRRRRHEDGEGKRSQVRRLPFYRYPRQRTARHRARFAFRRRQVQRRPCVRRLVDRRLEGHRSIRHAADAGPEYGQHRPVLRRNHAVPVVRRAGAGRRQGL